MVNMGERNRRTRVVGYCRREEKYWKERFLLGRITRERWETAKGKGE